MPSNINPSNINVNYPVAGQNQSSQGFRDNFFGIASNLTIAATEISALQSSSNNLGVNSIVLSGDVINVGTPPTLAGSGGNIQLVVSLNTQNLITELNPVLLQGTSSNYIFETNTKGIVTNFQTSAKTILNGGNSTSILALTSVTLNPQDGGYTSIPASILSANINSITVDEYGNLISSVITTPINFGLLGYPIPKAALLVGNGAGHSTYLTVSNDGYSLIGNSSAANGVSWQPVVNSISISSGLSTTSSTGTPNIGLSFNSLSNHSTLSTTDILAIYQGSTLGHKQINITDLTTGLETILDTHYVTQVMGSNLDTNGYSITSSTGNIILSSINTNSIVIDGATWPSNVPNSGGPYALITDVIGNCSWELLGNIQENQTISLIGDIVGNGTNSITTVLSTVNSNIGTFNTLTVNAKGQVTSATNTAYLTSYQTITISGDATGSGINSIVLTLKNTGTSGTYSKVTTDSQGRVTSGTNPTTLSGYGINDAVQNLGSTPSVQSGLYSTIPTPGTTGRLFVTTDTATMFQDNGSSWTLLEPAFRS